MEDAHISIPNFAPGISLFGVLDGHGGKGVSQVAAKILPDLIKEHPSFNSNPPNYNNALNGAFLEMDEYLRTRKGCVEALDMDHSPVNDDYEFIEKKPNGDAVAPCDNMGTTCVIALIFPRRIVVANLGDSRCVLSARISIDADEGGGTVICVPLTHDHKPGVPEEGARIVNAGGLIMRDMLGGYRINGGLNVSRCFGDFAYKKGEGPPQEQMISPVPDIRHYDFSNIQDICIILACDGIFERNTNEDVAHYVQKRLHPSMASKITGTLASKISAQLMAERLSEIGVKLCDASMCTYEERFSFEPQLRFTGQDNMTTLLVHVNLPVNTSGVAEELSPVFYDMDEEEVNLVVANEPRTAETLDS